MTTYLKGNAKGRILMLDSCIDTLSIVRLTFHRPNGIAIFVSIKQQVNEGFIS